MEKRLKTVLAGLQREEGGWLVLAGIVMAFLTVLTIGLAANLARTMRLRTEAQNTADNLAYSGTIPLARGMNTLAATQHLIGEVMAVSVIHSGFFGHFPEDHKIDTQWLPKHTVSPRTLEQLFNAVLLMPIPEKYKPDQAMHDLIKKRLRATQDKQKDNKISKGAIDDGDMQLAWVVLSSYQAQLVGAALYVIPLTKPLGIAILTLCKLIQDICHQEAKILAAMERYSIQAKAIQPATFQLVKGLHAYAKQVRLTVDGMTTSSNFPQQILQQTDQAEFSSTSRVFHAFPGLPVEVEKSIPRRLERDDRETYFKRQKNLAISQAQWVKAATPWVQSTRFQFVEKTQLMFFSRFSEFYRKRTGQYTLDLADYVNRGGASKIPMRPLVMHGTNKAMQTLAAGVNPSRAETWRKKEGQDLMHHLFGVVGIAWQKQPASRIKVFNDEMADLGAYAQAILYAADEHGAYVDKGKSSKHQDTSGWDTLAWKNRVPHYEWDQNGDLDQDRMPIARPNWQVKLVPASLISEALESGAGPSWKNLRGSAETMGGH